MKGGDIMCCHQMSRPERSCDCHGNHHYSHCCCTNVMEFSKLTQAISDLKQDIKSVEVRLTEMKRES